MLYRSTAREFVDVAHLELLRHQAPRIRQACAEDAGQYSRIQEIEVPILAHYLDLEIEMWRAARDGIVDADTQPHLNVIDALCCALGRIAQRGGDITLATPFLIPLVYQGGTLVRLSAAWALREYRRTVEDRRNPRRAV